MPRRAGRDRRRRRCRARPASWRSCPPTRRPRRSARSSHRVLADPAKVDVLVVDDSSPDGTASIVRELDGRRAAGPPTRAPGEIGARERLPGGVRRALEEGYDLIVEMDSDLSHDPAELGALLEAAATALDLDVGQPVRAGWVGDELEPAPRGAVQAGNTYARMMLGFPCAMRRAGSASIDERCCRTWSRAHPRRRLRLPGRARDASRLLGLTSGRCRSRSANVSTATRRSREASSSRRLWLVTRWGLALRALGRPYPEHTA